MPAGAIGISVGVSLRSVSTLTLDDLLLQDSRTPLPVPVHVATFDGDEPTAATATIKVAKGRPADPRLRRPCPQNLLTAQTAVETDLATVRRAGFTPVSGRALTSALAGRPIGTAKPVVLAFAGSVVDSIGLADGLLARDGAQGVLLTPPANVLKPSSLARLAKPSRWSFVSPTSPAGRAIRSRTLPGTRALRIPMTFKTTPLTLVRALRSAVPRRTR